MLLIRCDLVHNCRSEVPFSSVLNSDVVTGAIAHSAKIFSVTRCEHKHFL